MEAKKSNSSEIKHLFFLFIMLFGFWALLSGHFDVKHLTIGFVSSVFIVWITRPLLQLHSTTDNKIIYGFDLPYLKFLAYWPWLLWQIVVANIEIAYVVLHPKLPINPQIITFRKKMSNPLAHVTLANSITLTPGTVTIDINDDLYIVHALTDNAAQGLVPDEGEGEMPQKVAQVFGEQRSEEVA